MANISIGDLTDEITNILNEYSDEAIKAMPEAAKEAANLCVKTLKNKAPSKSGKYKKSFKKKLKSSSSSLTEYTIYSTIPSLPHLLERGHTIRNKYGVYGVTKAHPHWADAEKAANDKFEDKLKKAVEDA